VDCPRCGVTVKWVPWAEGKQQLTRTYGWFLARWAKRLLWVGQKRTVKTLLRFFRWLGEERSAGLQFICSDMWKPYLKVIAKQAGDAVHILDRFHIMGHLGRAIDEVRTREAGELKAKGLEPVLKKSRWCLLKRPENLTAKPEVRLADLR